MQKMYEQTINSASKLIQTLDENFYVFLILSFIIIAIIAYLFTIAILKYKRGNILVKLNETCSTVIANNTNSLNTFSEQMKQVYEFVQKGRK